MLLRVGLSILVMVFWAFPLWGESTTIIADADIMEKNSVKKTLSLKGNVNVIFQQQHLLCDEATVFEDTSTIVAMGNVILQNARTTLRGERIELNYDTNKGVLYNGVVTSGQVLLEAKEIIKIGEEQYQAEDAYFTACTTCPASWGFTSANIEAEIGGYAYISRPWLHLLQFPVLPLPYLVLPLNSKRQTGFLVPMPSTNNDGGLAIEFPFYWAIDRSHDATFSLINYEKRGQQLLGNYRYVVSPTSSGELNASFMKDRVFGFQDRWFMQYQHHYDLPNNYTQRTELALTSDRFYVQDFPRQFLYLGKPALDNRASISKAFESSLLTFDASYYISLIEPSQNASLPTLNPTNQDSLHRLPEINFELLDQKVSEDYNLFFNLNAQYLNIASNGVAFRHARATNSECILNEEVCFYNESPTGDFIYGAPEGGTVANDAYGDLIRTGQRLDVMTELHAPFWIGQTFDIDPSLSLRYTQYALGVASDPSQGYDSTPSRFYPQLGLSTRSYFHGFFDWNDTHKIKHSIIPAVDLRYIPEVFQSQHNFFGTNESLRLFREQQPIDNTDADWRNGGRGIQFDNRDRIIGKQLVNFSLINKLISRSTKADTATVAGNRYGQNLIFEVAQAYDINEAQRGDDARPWQDIRTNLIFNGGPFAQSINTASFPYHNRTNWSTSSTYSFLGNNYVQLTYFKWYTINLNPPVDDSTKREGILLGTGLNFRYVNFVGFVEYDLTAEESKDRFVRWRTLATVVPPGNCWSFKFGVTQFMLTGIINPEFSMEFRFSE